MSHRTRPSPNGGDALLTRLRERAQDRAAELSPEASTIVAVWNTEYATKLTDASSTLHLKHLCVETNRIGTTYYERSLNPRPEVTEALLGRDILRDPLPEIWNIAALDALYGNLIREPDADHNVGGTAGEKASVRAGIVCNEVRRVAEENDLDPQGLKVVNVGVVGDFIKNLTDSGMSVTATDFYKFIVGTKVHGVTVKPGEMHREMVEYADIALVTGMSLANDTLDGIFESAAQSGTRLVLFAESGANFADEYVAAGAESVISEPFPFYLSGSDSCRVRVYRKATDGPLS